MSLTISRSAIKDRCGIAALTEFDSAIDSLITAMIPAIETTLADGWLTNPSAGIMATLNLAATEIVAGEFLGQLWRAPGFVDEVSAAGVTIRPRIAASDPAILKAQGLQRLAPYLKSGYVPAVTASVGVATGKRGEEDS